MIFSAHDFPSLNGATFLSQAAQVDSLDSLMQERAVLSLVSPCFTMFNPRYHGNPCGSSWSFREFIWETAQFIAFLFLCWRLSTSTVDETMRPL